MKRVKTKGVWNHPLRRFYKFLEYCDKYNLPKTILIIGSADGNLAIAAAKRGFKVTAVEMNEKLIFGGEPVLIDNKWVEVIGMLKRIELEGDIDGLIEYKLGDYMTLDNSKKYSLIFTSNSIHYPENLKYRAEDLVGKMVDLLDDNGFLLLEYVHESEESKKYQGHYLNKNQMKKILEDRKDNNIIRHVVKVYYENGNIVDGGPHKITIARVYVRKNGKFVDNLDSAKYYDALPRFSHEIYDYLEKIGVKNSIVADVGSGTGRICIDLLERGNSVYAIDPDSNMRNICERKCSKYDKFISIDGLDIDLKIPDKSVDYVIVSQSFHRFNPILFKKECRRVLRNPNNTIIIWYRVDYENPIIKEMLASVKKNFKDYASRYETNEIIGSMEEEKANNLDAKEFFDGDSHMVNINSKAELNLDEFINLGLSLSLFPISHKITNISKLLEEKSFNKEQYVEDLKDIFNKYSNNENLELIFNVQIHSHN